MRRSWWAGCIALIMAWLVGQSGARSVFKTLTWSKVTTGGDTVPSGVTGNSILMNGTNMIVVAGSYGGTVSSDCWALDMQATTAEWSLLTSGPDAFKRYAHSSVLYGHRIVVFGGYSELYGSAVDDVWTLDLSASTLAWAPMNTTGGDDSLARSSYASVLNGTNMVVFGGSPPSLGTLNDVWVLELAAATPAWYKMETTGGNGPPPKRRYPEAVLYGGKMVVFGGYVGTNALNDLWQLDLSTKKWDQLESSTKPSVRYGFTAALFGTNLVVFGGGATNQGSSVNDAWALDLSAAPSWSQITAAGGGAPSERMPSGVTVWGNSMLVFGGQDKSAAYLSDVWSLSFEWDCALPTGHGGRTEDCTMLDVVEVTESLGITGVPSSEGKLPKIIGSGSNRLFHVSTDGALTLKYLNLTGGIIDDGYGYGGAVRNNQGELQVEHCVFHNNIGKYGGAISSERGTLNIYMSSLLFFLLFLEG
jgi:hypothetical protein